VIRKPAKRAGIEITDELVERLKHDTPTAEALPLLAFTLEKLYRGYASDGRLEFRDYESLGGIKGSIQKCVERIVPPHSLPASEAAVRLTFVKHLAQVNDKGEVVRLTARWADLPAPAKPILEKFVNERLLIRSGNKDEGTPGQGSVSVEVAHEAMFRCWDDLEGWLRTSAGILRWRRDVRRDQKDDPKWTGLRPAQLAVSRDWPRRRRDELTAEEIDWINRGIRWEWIRRGIVTTVVLVVALSAVIAGWQSYEANSATHEAKRQEAIAQKNANQAKEQARIADEQRTNAQAQVRIAKQTLSRSYFTRACRLLDSKNYYDGLAYLVAACRADPETHLRRRRVFLRCSPSGTGYCPLPRGCYTVIRKTRNRQLNGFASAPMAPGLLLRQSQISARARAWRASAMLKMENC